MSVMLDWTHRPCSVDDCGTCVVDQQNWPCDAEVQRKRADSAIAALGSFLWLGNNLHNSGTETFRDLYRASLEDARTAYEAGGGKGA